MKHMPTRTARWAIVIAAILMVMSTAQPQRARAQWTDFLNLVPNLLSAVKSVLTYVQGEFMTIKEEVLDPLAWALAKQLIQSVTADTVDWINSGFKGNPAFLNNPTSFFLDAADQATGEFISNHGALSNLCSPFSLDIRLSLGLQMAYNSGMSGEHARYICTLSSIIDAAQNSSVSGSVSFNGTTVAGGSASANGNVNSFINGNFSQGGWPAFIAMTTAPQNNFSGAYLMAESDLNAQISTNQAKVNADLTAGAGFLSYTKCDDLGTADELSNADAARAIAGNDPNVTARVNNDGSVTYQDCHTETPGSVIAASLNKQVGAGTDSLVTADEFDEVLSAALGQLVKTVIGGGLLSSSKTSSGATKSAIASLRTASNGTATSFANNVVASVSKFIPIAKNYVGIEQKSVDLINSLRNFYLGLCKTKDSDAGLVAINTLLSSYQDKRDTASTSYQILLDLKTAVAAVKSSPTGAVAGSMLYIDNSTGVSKGFAIGGTTATGPGTTATSPVITSVDSSSGAVIGKGFVGTQNVYLMYPGADSIKVKVNYIVTDDTDMTVYLDTADQMNQLAQLYSDLLSSSQIANENDVTDATKDQKTLKKTLAQLKAKGVNLKKACAGSTVNTTPIPTITAFDINQSTDPGGITATVTGIGFTYATDAYVTNTLLNGARTDIFDGAVINSDTSMTIDIDPNDESTVPGDNNLVIVNTTGASAPFKIEIPSP